MRGHERRVEQSVATLHVSAYKSNKIPPEQVKMYTGVIFRHFKKIQQLRKVAHVLS